jgi:hypothetical protein
MGYTIKITNVSDDAMPQQTFSVTMDTGTCKPSSGVIPKVGEKPVTLTVDADDATGTITFSYGGKLTVKQRMDAGKYPDGADSLWVNEDPQGQVNADASAEEGDNNIKITRP